MGFVDYVKDIRDRWLYKEIRAFNASELTPEDDLPYQHNWFHMALLGVPRNLNVIELRQYGKSIWAQMIFSAIKKQIFITDWDIVPLDETDQTDYSADIEKTKTLLNQPNRNGETFAELWGKYIHDVLESDAGVIFKGRTPGGDLTELWAHDGTRFLFDMDEHGVINGYYQYSAKYPSNAPKFFEKDEIVYGKLGNNTELFPYGWAPLQSLMQEIETMIQSTRYNKEFFRNNAMPSGMIKVNMAPDELERFKLYWQQKIRGKAHKLPFINSADAEFIPFNLNNRDMEWLEGQKWYMHAIFAGYGLSPQEVGYYENSNRSTGESQERVSIKNAVKPHMQLISDKITREIMIELLGHDKLEFRWYPKDDVAEKIEHEQTIAKLVANVITINEVRIKEGLDPVEWGDKPFTMVMQENFVELNGDNPNGEKDEKGEKESEEDRDDKKDRDEDKDETRKLYRKLLTGFVKDGKRSK